MENTRKLVAPAALSLIVAWGAWLLISGWGLVTLDYRDAPVQIVLASIARQGGIEIISDLDPSIPVTIKVKRVPPGEALDIVAVRTDSAWRIAYLGADSNLKIDTAIASFRSGTPTDDWSAYGGGGFSFIESASGAVLDLRKAKWTPSGPGKLHALLDEASRRTGAMTAAPTAWQPDAKAPGAGPLGRAIPQLLRSAGGVVREVFLLRGRPRRDAGEPEFGRGERGTWIGMAAARGERGGGPSPMRGDPAQMAERIEAQIALLPRDEQPQARRDFEEMRKIWDSLKDLPEEERRAKAREFFSRPEVAERMEERRAAREAKMTPEQRIDRAKRYFERKKAAKEAAQGSAP